MACYRIERGKHIAMKYAALLVLLVFSLCASAQNSKSVSKSVSDDGKTLKLKYEVIGSGKNISYSKEYDVNGWSKVQKDQLVARVIDSLENSGGSQNDYVTKRIDDNGQTMTVFIEAKNKDRHIKYDKSFDVKGKSPAEKKAMIEELMKSLGITEKKD